MRTRLERAIDKRDDLKHYIDTWGWSHSPSQGRHFGRALAKAQAKVARLTLKDES